MNIFCLSLHLFGLSCMEQWEEVTIWGWVSWRAQVYNGTCVSLISPLLSGPPSPVVPGNRKMIPRTILVLGPVTAVRPAGLLSEKGGGGGVFAYLDCPQRSALPVQFILRTAFHDWHSFLACFTSNSWGLGSLCHTCYDRFLPGGIYPNYESFLLNLDINALREGPSLNIPLPVILLSL